jgi:hypothetical protein
MGEGNQERMPFFLLMKKATRSWFCGRRKHNHPEPIDHLPGIGMKGKYNGKKAFLIVLLPSAFCLLLPMFSIATCAAFFIQSF